MKILILFSIFFVHLTSAVEVKYFYGQSHFYFPNTAYEKSINSLIKRTVDSKRERIEEIVTQPGKDPNEKPSEMITLITKITDDVFQAEDITNASFSGTITFLRKYDQWTYNLKIGQGTLTGSGTLSKAGIITNKTLKLPQFQYERTIKEELKPINKKEYLKRRKEILQL